MKTWIENCLNVYTDKQVSAKLLSRVRRELEKLVPTNRTEIRNVYQGRCFILEHSPSAD